MTNDPISTYIESLTHKLIWTKALLALAISNESNNEQAEALDGILFIVDLSLTVAESLLQRG